MSGMSESKAKRSREEQGMQIMGCIMQSRAPELYDWQEDHTDKLVTSLKKHGVAKDGSDTGTGKTVVALECAKRLGLTPFVIAPKSVLSSWKEWHVKFFPLIEEPMILNYEKLRMGRTPYLEKTGRRVRWRLNPKKILVIFDEVHRCKGDKSLNGKMLAAAKTAGLKTLMLSATACSNPTEMKAMGYALGMHKYTDWWQWCLRHGCRRGFFGGLEFRNDRKTLNYLHESMYGVEGKGGRIRIADLGDAFPETLITADSYDVADPGEIDKVYEDMRDELDTLAERASEDDDSPLVAQLRARQRVELLKVPIFVELAKDAHEAHNSVVIFVSFRQTLEALSDRLVDDADGLVTIHGDQSGEDRAEVIRLFQSNEARVCVCMIQAGGTGLSLHDEAGGHPRISLISPTFSAIELRQALGRVHRANGKSKSVQKIIFAAGTVEDRVAAAVRRKLNNLDMINDGELTPF